MSSPMRYGRVPRRWAPGEARRSVAILGPFGVEIGANSRCIRFFLD